MKMNAVFAKVFLLMMVGSIGDSQDLNSTITTPPLIVFDPSELVKVPGGQSVRINWNTTLEGVHNFSISVSDEIVATVDKGAFFVLVADGSNVTVRGSFNLTADILGYNTITLTLFDKNGQIIGSKFLEMTVVISYQGINELFTSSIGVLLALAYINMGAAIDLSIVKGIVFKPIGPMLGILCQFVGMPLIAFGLGMTLFKDQPLYRIGIFMGGCVPGGGASNMWTHLLGGSLDLSIMMTFASTMTAFAALPLWLFSLGPIVSADADFVVPYKDIAVVAVSLIIPCAIGLIIQKFLPKVAKILDITLSPFSLFIIFYIFTFGIYTNWYIFRIATLKVWLTGAALPFLGYILGTLLSSIFRLSWKDRIAIGIETGIQNMSIAVFMLNFTLDQPAGNLSVVVPACAVFTSPFPLLSAYAFKLIYSRLKTSKSIEVTKSDALPEKAAATDGSCKKGLPNNCLEMGNCQKIFANSASGVDNPAADFAD